MIRVRVRVRLNKSLFSQRCLQSFFIFRSRVLADVFEKDGKKNKTTSVYRLLVSYLSLIVSYLKGRVKFKKQHSLNSYVRSVSCKGAVTLGNFSCNLSRNFVATQVARCDTGCLNHVTLGNVSQLFWKRS